MKKPDDEKTKDLLRRELQNFDDRKLRYDPDNKFILCYSCHFTFHRKPLAFAEFVKEKKGEDMYKYILKSSQIVKPLNEKFYQDIINNLKKE